MIELSKDDMKCIEEFESQTGAAVVDCLISDAAVAFIVKQGDLGRAIGRKGANITRVRQAFARQVLVFDGKHLTVLYTYPDALQAGEVVFNFSLNYRGTGSDAAGLTEDVEAGSDAIVASVTLLQ